MHGHDDVEVVLRHAGDHPVAHDSGVVHDGVDAAVRPQGAVEQLADGVEVDDRCAVGRRHPAGRLDLGDDLLGGGHALGLPALEADAEIVDHDGGPVAGELKAVLAPEAPPRARDDHHPAVEEPHRRVGLPLVASVALSGYSVQ